MLRRRRSAGGTTRRRGRPAEEGVVRTREWLGEGEPCSRVRTDRAGEAMVVSTPQGRYTLYQLSDPRVGTLLSLADELLSDVARGVYECTRY